MTLIISWNNANIKKQQYAQKALRKRTIIQMQQIIT